MEGMSSLLVAQKLGQEGKKLVEAGETYQFGLLIASAVAYVASAWWIVVVSLVLVSRSMSLILLFRHILQPHTLLCLPRSWV